MENFSSGIYPVAILVFLSVAVLILAFFKMVRFLMPYTKFTQSQTGTIVRLMPVAELAAWMIYLIWAMQYLGVRGYLATLFPVIVFIIVILYLAWYGLKDIIAGIVFKSSYDLHINDHISVQGISGKVMAIMHTRLELEENSGQIISIPYSKIAGNLIFRNYPSQTMLSHHFKLEVALPESHRNIFDLTEKIRIAILAMPWASQKRSPKISVEEEQPETIIFAITIFSIDESYFSRMEKILEKEFRGKVLRA
jgi:hypothetical protein